jgi:hypothetical protein
MVMKREDYVTQEYPHKAQAVLDYVTRASVETIREETKRLNWLIFLKLTGSLIINLVFVVCRYVFQYNWIL